VIENLGQKPSMLAPVSYAGSSKMQLPKYQRKQPAKKELVGVDVFVHWAGEDPSTLANLVKKMETNEMALTMVTNRGIKVWPEGFSETFCTDHWRCRFKQREGNTIKKEEVIQLLQNAIQNDVDAIKTENLYHFDGIAKFSLGQGQ
jgi:isocitrate dehydrogenase